MIQEEVMEKNDNKALGEQWLGGEEEKRKTILLKPFSITKFSNFNFFLNLLPKVSLFTSFSYSYYIYLFFIPL